jgi:4-hydroxythreonine-4-phosphate dehydrogenase
MEGMSGVSQEKEARKPALALTRGDPSGFGPELALRAWHELHSTPGAEAFFIVADPEHLRDLALKMRIDVPVEVIASGLDARERFATALPVLPQGCGKYGGLGQPDVRDAAATIGSIETCVELVKKGEASAVVTSPIAKEVLYQAGFAHPGHTEFLGELSKRYYNVDAKPVMMIWSELLAVVPATIHIPVAEVPQKLTRSLLVKTGIIVAKDLAEKFGMSAPRLAFTGLNPHAGEGGAMGREEIDIILPALEELRTFGIHVSGPHPADTLFHAAARKNYDAVIGMYHDQVLIPVKTLAFDTGVNVTLGLPFIRTSPDHGTAFGIADKFVANPASLIAALKLAGRMQRHAACQGR